MARVKIKDLTIRVFYKFLLYIKPGYICCYLQKKINNPPPPTWGVWRGHQSFTCLNPAKTLWLLFDWTAPWKFLILIIWFSGGEAGQVCGVLFMVDFGQILPLSSTHHGFFLLISSEICWDIELIFNIYNLCYHIVVLKKTLVLKKNSSRTLFGQKLGQHGPHPNWSSIVFLEITKGDYKLSRTFYFI